MITHSTLCLEFLCVCMCVGFQESICSRSNMGRKMVAGEFVAKRIMMEIVIFS